MIKLMTKYSQDESKQSLSSIGALNIGGIVDLVIQGYMVYIKIKIKLCLNFEHFKNVIMI